MSAPSLRHRPRLVALCVGGVVVETLLVWAFAPSSALGLAAQATAPTPFDVFHDVWWIIVYHESWLGFAAEVLALLALLPLPYARDDTHRSLQRLAEALGTQVAEYARRTGNPVTIVAESEGSLVAKALSRGDPRRAGS